MNRNVKIALAIAAILVIWFATGLLGNGPLTRTPADSPATGEDRFLVRVEHARAVDYRRRLSVRGISEPNRSVRLKAEISGRVVAVPAAKGRPVSAGEVICRLAEEDRQQQLTEARSALERARMEYQGVLRLKKSGLQSEIEIARAREAVDRAEAQLKRRQLAVANLDIEAPFSGYLEERYVEVGDYLASGQPCARVVEIDPLKVLGHVAGDRIAMIREGQAASIDFGQGVERRGRVTYVARTPDPDTKTYRVELQTDNPGGRLKAGTAVNISIPLDSIEAHRVPSAVLSLNDAGDLGVYLVDDDNTARFAEVMIVGEDARGVWVSGLPETATIITLGQEYISAGQTVAIEDGGEAG